MTCWEVYLDGCHGVVFAMSVSAETFAKAESARMPGMRVFIRAVEVVGGRKAQAYRRAPIASQALSHYLTHEGM